MTSLKTILLSKINKSKRQKHIAQTESEFGLLDNIKCIHNQKNSKFNVGDNVQTNEEHYTMVNHKITRGGVVDMIYSRRSCDPNEFYWVYKIKLMNDTYEFFDEGWLERCSQTCVNS